METGAEPDAPQAMIATKGIQHALSFYPFTRMAIKTA
jgi:hypothetical protein